MKRSKHAVGECYKTLNIHDPHEQYVWADAEPAWLKVLQVLGVIAGAVSMFTLLWLFTVIVFLL
jgi:hypothetical protein